MATRSAIGAIDWDYSSCNLSGIFVGKPKNQISNILWLEPLGIVRAGHGFAVRWSVHRPRKKHVGGETCIPVFQSDCSHQHRECALKRYIRPEACMRLCGG